MKRKTPPNSWPSVALTLLGLLGGVAAPAWAGDRVLAASGVSEVEGAAGGGLTPWAVIGGEGSRDQIGASAFGTGVRTRGGYALDAEGVAVGLYDTVELSATQWRFGLSDTVPGVSLHMQGFGLKWRVCGDAVFDADRWQPQVAVGLQYKRDVAPVVPRLLGARRTEDVEPYVAMTKLWFGAAGGYNLLANLTLRATRANQMGLLGFGGDRDAGRHLEPEASIAVLPRDSLALGVEWRAKPSNLSAAPETRAADLFVAWWPMRHLSVTVAWLDLGQIANKTAQRSSYVSVQAQF
ncbi:MAG: DUF3034 family protein [Pelomonas sp.]|nr:DUF3034 family protein [Roseateles sp.]